MMSDRNTAQSIQPRRRDSERGVALLTVTALLTIFAAIMAGFVYTIRMEEFTVQNYAASVNVEEAAESAVQGVLAQLADDLDPTKQHDVMGRLQPRYVSQLDPWYIGYQGKANNNISYDASAFMLDSRPSTVVNRTGIKFVPTPIPRGIDEDPRGDVTGSRALGQSGRGDGKPGLGGIDDNQDGIVDDGGDDLLSSSDDDEDFRVDEDQPDRRRDGLFFPNGTGYDNDGDLVGVFDESSKINLNYAGNNSGLDGSYVYNQGVHPNELDLPVFLYNRVVSYTRNNSVRTFSSSEAQQLARYIVNFRNGSASDGGQTNSKPGRESFDDNNNNSPTILDIQKMSNVFDTQTFNGEPFAIVGNNLDDDDDGLTNEEDETYIGATTISTSGSPISQAIDQKQGNLDQFRPGNKIDDDGDGFIDEEDEGIDDPSEFNVYRPKGDDRPFSTHEDLNLLTFINGDTGGVPPRIQSPPPSLFKILRDSTTIWSQSDEISGPLSSGFNEVGKINPNAGYNWRAQDTWTQGGSSSGIDIIADFQYSPPLRIEDLFALQVDQDNDWQPEAESDVLNGKPNGIDDDGDGLVDEPSDDWDGNFYPSGDFDGFAEPDVGSPLTLENGIDDDQDGSLEDEARGGDDNDGRLRRLPLDQNEDSFDGRYRNENDREFRSGMNIEGNGQDDDKDGLVDDLGDFNGDGLLAFDPEWHVSEDAWGDLSGDGFPGLGADIDADEDTPEGDIIAEPQRRDDMVVTNFADDDYDGYADFYDPQVLAAMYAPEMDGVDNDSDGEVDEVGERYIAAYDDDEDGRMDEDPPEFQIALNLFDSIDTWAPYTPTEERDVRQLLGKSEDDIVLSDPVTRQTFNLFSSRQRAFRMHSRLLAGPNRGSRELELFEEQMRLLLPNPPQTGMEITFEGVESIRINEVMAKPVIRLEMEDVFESIEYDPTNPSIRPVATMKRNRFEPGRRGGGFQDDGQIPLPNYPVDTNWGLAPSPITGETFPHMFLPNGFVNTFNPVFSLANLDAMAPATIFMVTNVRPQLLIDTTIGIQPEIATWNFENIPEGYYDVVIYLHPKHELNPLVSYYFNGSRAPFPVKSDKHVIASDGTLQEISLIADPFTKEVIRRDTAQWNNGIDQPSELILPYRLSWWPGNAPDFSERFSDPRVGRVQVRSNGKLSLRIEAAPIDEADPRPDNHYVTSIDRIELINPYAQYVELVNLGLEDINMSGWTITTPYGHYMIPDDDENSIIARMKPAWADDTGLELKQGEGLPGAGVPSEPLLAEDRLGNPLSNEELRLEDNKMLLVNNLAGFRSFLTDNYAKLETEAEDRILVPLLVEIEEQAIGDSIDDFLDPDRLFPNAQLGDLGFRLFDYQEDVLTHNPREKKISLYDPAGNYVDSFTYRTTFNNAIVDIQENGAGIDVVALPGYKGMESFERTDPTYFETNFDVSPADWKVRGVRSVPSSIKLDAKDAIVIDMQPNRRTGQLRRNTIGGYADRTRGLETDFVRDDLERFVDRDMAGLAASFKDSWWNGWDFIGDYFDYPREMARGDRNLVRNLERSASMMKEAAIQDGAEKVIFYDTLGGFENLLNVRPNRISDVRYTAFVWRMGLRELTRAGYDPNIDDQFTVRVLGRQYVARERILVNDGGNIRIAANPGDRIPFDMPVGEVLIEPAFRIIDPGSNPLNDDADIEANPDNIYQPAGQRRSKVPIFAKLRNGDTAFTVDLRKEDRELWQDLRNDTDSEPMVEITVVMRKSTPDLKMPLNRVLNVANRPDLDNRVPFPITDEDGDGFYEAAGTTRTDLGSVADDNYFFKGIELFGRVKGEGQRRKNDPDAFQRLIAGTPGWDNSGYVPAYPRRRLDLRGSSRDPLDIIDNTAYVKNGPLATIGEISRLHTGNKFETINTPIIPQRLEDAAMERGQIMPNPQLAQRSTNDEPRRLQLAQRERLDQWENQYTQLYNMVTTGLNGILPGKINVNTASREVLSALPSTPPIAPGQIEPLIERSLFNNLVADFIIEGRQPTGRDMSFGVQGLNDDMLSNDANRLRTAYQNVDTMSEFKFMGVGREFRFFKNFDDIVQRRFNKLNLKPLDILDTQLDFDNVYLSTPVVAPDDGPYADIGTLMSQLTHLRRRERFSAALRRPVDRTLDGKPDLPGDLRDRLNAELGRELTTEDMEALMNRISNLITVKSRAFGILAQGRIFDSDGNIIAQRKLETVYVSE
ncbi:MAG: hypothetical protein P9L94_17300 [Candidatus Hinthialibacter antarcticus]|nr:hypothetical protein [Candidatus Hinthialibacter antarcticus]